MDTKRLAFIVDDEDGLCKFIATALARWQVEADSFRTAEQALAALDRRIPAIIFLDIALKHSDAVDVIRGLGERNFAGAVQLMSGSDPILLADVCRIGARHGLEMLPPLSKPFRTAAIQDALASASIGGRVSAAAPDTTIRRQDLDQALAEGWLELWYQPKIDLRTMALVGAEGLIRCNHPDHGILTPASLLPHASEAGLRALTEYVVVQALRDWCDFAASGLLPRLAVNSSLSGLVNPQIIALIREYRPNGDQWPGPNHRGDRGGCRRRHDAGARDRNPVAHLWCLARNRRLRRGLFVLRKVARSRIRRAQARQKLCQPLRDG